MICLIRKHEILSQQLYLLHFLGSHTTKRYAPGSWLSYCMQFDHEMDLQLIPAVARLSPAGCSYDQTWIPLIGSTIHLHYVAFVSYNIFGHHYQIRDIVQGCPVRFTYMYAHYLFWKVTQIRCNFTEWLLTVNMEVIDWSLSVTVSAWCV